MRFDRLDLNLLVVLDALISERSVSAAARRINVSQPAISGSLSRLRQYFGDELLVYAGRQMTLTSKAESLAAPVRRALTLIRSEITSPGSFDPRTAKRTFIIVASDYTYSVLLADAIAAATRIAPAVGFDILQIDRRATERFERAEADLLITPSPYVLEEHPRVALFSDEEAVICWSKGIHRRGIDRNGFFEAGHAIAFFGDDRQPAMAEMQFNRMGLERRIELRVPTFGALPQAVTGSNRLATMHRRHAEFLAGMFPIRIHPLPISMPPVVEEVQWHRMRDRDEGVRWLLELLKAQAGLIAASARSAGPAVLRQNGRART